MSIWFPPSQFVSIDSSKVSASAGKMIDAHSSEDPQEPETPRCTQAQAVALERGVPRAESVMISRQVFTNVFASLGRKTPKPLNWHHRRSRRGSGRIDALASIDSEFPTSYVVHALVI